MPGPQYYVNDSVIIPFFLKYSAFYSQVRTTNLEEIFILVCFYLPLQLVILKNLIISIL